MIVPASGCSVAGDHLEQRRLAGPVGADDPDDAGAGERERQVLDEQPIAEALAQTVDLDDGVAQTRTRRDGDLQLLVLGPAGLGFGLQLLVGSEPSLALRLASAWCHANPFQLTFEGAPAGDVGALLAGEALLLLLQPRAVVALERDAPAMVELEDPAGDVVEEVAIVGDRHHRAGVALEELLEPVDALGVEVVGRLVEQQQIGAAQQQAAQGDATALAAGQRGDVGVVGRAAQSVHGDLDVAFEAPRVGGGDLVLEDRLLGADLVVVGVRVGPLGHHGVVLVDDRLHGGDTVHHVALDVLVRIEVRLLGEVADGEPRRQSGLTGEAVVEPGHDLEQ